MQEVKPLTARQRQVLNFLNCFVREKGYSPSLKEIARELKTSNLSTAQYFVEQLKEKGYLKKNEGKTRGITPLANLHTIPLLGYIAAGKPIEPIEDSEPIEVPTNIRLSQNQSYYALKVKGNSMIDMGVLDNDIVLVRHQMSADIGDVVVGITEKGATLKVLGKRKGRVVLEPKNPRYDTIIPRQLEVRGVFIGLIRT